MFAATCASLILAYQLHACAVVANDYTGRAIDRSDTSTITVSKLETGYASIMEPVFTDIQKPPNVLNFGTWYREFPRDTVFQVFLGGTEDNHEYVTVRWDAPKLVIEEVEFYQFGWEYRGICTINTGETPGDYEIAIDVSDGIESSTSTMMIRVVE